MPTSTAGDLRMDALSNKNQLLTMRMKPIHMRVIRQLTQILHPANVRLWKTLKLLAIRKILFQPQFLFLLP